MDKVRTEVDKNFKPQEKLNSSVTLCNVFIKTCALHITKFYIFLDLEIIYQKLLFIVSSVDSAGTV